MPLNTKPLSAFDLSSHLLLSNAMIDQGQSRLANSMISTCQVGSSDTSTDANAAVSLYNGCNYMHLVGSIQEESCSVTQKVNQSAARSEH